MTQLIYAILSLTLQILDYRMGQVISDLWEMAF